MDPIETGPGEVERDAAAFAKHAETPMGGPARHLARGINRVSARGDGHDAAIRGLAERALAMVNDFDGRLSAVVSRTEGIPQLRREVADLGAEVLRIADELRARIGGVELEVFPVLRGGAARTAPPSSADLDQRDRFLEPPPIARAIGKAVMRAADGLPIHDRRTVNATLLGERLALVLRTIPIKPGEAHDLLTDTIAEAKRAGVIP